MKNRETERLSLNLSSPEVTSRALQLPIQKLREMVSGVAKRPKSSLKELQVLDDAVHLKPRRRMALSKLSFFAMVALPFLCSLYYYWHLASDQFIAEARFAVRSIQDNETSTDSASLAMGAAYQDAFVVTSFIHSPEILARIKTKFDYRAVFARPDADRFARFPPDGSVEDFLDYWQSHVTAYIDGPSGIITLKVRTFSPNDSQELAKLIITESEQLINELNQRAQHDLVAGIKSEVERSGVNYAEALSQLNSFQHASGLLSPDIQAKETGKILTALVAQKLEFETRIFVLKQGGLENSPALQQLISAKESVDSQITKLQQDLTGPENASIAKAIVDFSKVETNRLIAEKLYEAARKTYDFALAASMRKALYLTVFVHPSLPDESTFPRRFSTPVFIGTALMVLWGTLMLLAASVKDHSL